MNINNNLAIPLIPVKNNVDGRPDSAGPEKGSTIYVGKELAFLAELNIEKKSSYEEMIHNLENPIYDGNIKSTKYAVKVDGKLVSSFSQDGSSLFSSNYSPAITGQPPNFHDYISQLKSMYGSSRVSYEEFLVGEGLTNAEISNEIFGGDYFSAFNNRKNSAEKQILELKNELNNMYTIKIKA